MLGYQRNYLKGLAHARKPVVHIGKDGVTDAVIKQVNEALLAHELIKVRLVRPPDKKIAAAELGSRTQAALCELIGHTVILYRSHPTEPHIKLPVRDNAEVTDGGEPKFVM